MKITTVVAYGGRVCDYRGHEGTPCGDGNGLCLDQSNGNTGITFITTHWFIHLRSACLTDCKFYLKNME